MATSTNYLWTEPNDSDLVKNGASAIRTLGNAIDTSVWNVGFGQAGKNKIINGDFGIWQRGTTFTSPATSVYTADRYATLQNGTGTSTISQQSFTPGTAPVAGYESTYFLRHLVTAVGTSTANGVEQRIESVRTFANQTMTVSFWAKADAARTISLRVDQSFGSGGSGSVIGTTYTFSATTSWTRFSQAITVPSVAGKTIGAGDYIVAKIFNANTLNSQLDLWGLQAEYGSYATPFQTSSGGSQEGELAACQRYYYRYTPTAAGRFYGLGFNDATTSTDILVNYPVQMRTSPTALEQSGTATDYSVRTPAAGIVVCNGVPVFQQASIYNCVTTFGVAAGLVAGNATYGRAVNTNAYLGWSAEIV